MKPLIRKAVKKAFIAIVICAILSALLTGLAPVLMNEVAMGQLENDNFGFVAMETASHVQNMVASGEVLVVLICGASIAVDFVKYFNDRKENITNE